MDKKVLHRVLNIQDIHFYDKNIGLCINYRENSLKIFDTIINEVIKPLDIRTVVFGGDIFHRIISDPKYIGEIMDRFIELNKIADVYGIMGNHDKPSAKAPYKYFHFLADRKLIKREKFIRFGPVKINLVDNANTIDDLFRQREEDVTVNIGIYHDNIDFKDFPSDYFRGKLIDPEIGFLDNIDIAILNHMHNGEGYFEATVNNKRKKFYICPSLGRTDVREFHIRDSAKMVIINIMEDFSVELSEVEVPLPSIEESFDLTKRIEVKKKELSFKEFSESIESLKMSFSSLEDEINKLSVEQEVKERCRMYLQKVIYQSE